MGGSPQQAPTPYQPAYQPGADSSYQQGASQLGNAGTNLYNSIAPQLSSAVNGVTNNPYYSQAQAGAQAASNTAMGQVAPQQLGNSQSLSAFSQASWPAALQTLYGAFDPQQALYARGFQQQQDQSNAVNSMYGLQSSPYGAGVANQASQNFNIDWQNNQLARQMAALGAYDTNLGAAGGAATTASNLGTQALNTQAGASALPYNLANQQAMSSLSALGQQAQTTNAALAPTQQSIGDWAAYLGLGQSASAGSANAAQVNNQANSQASAGIGKLLGDAFGLIAAPFTGGTSLLARGA